MFPEVGGHVASTRFPNHRELGVPAVCIKSTETMDQKDAPQPDEDGKVKLSGMRNFSEILTDVSTARLPKHLSNSKAMLRY